MVSNTVFRQEWAKADCKKLIDLTEVYTALDDVLHAHNYTPKKGETGAFNCRNITDGTDHSRHAYDPNGFFTFWSGVRVTMACAVDINWNSNPYGPVLITDMSREMVDDVLKIKTNTGKQLLRWGGDYSGNKDAMHYEIDCSPADVSSGVNQSTVVKLFPKVPTVDSEDEMEIIEVTDGVDKGTLWLRQGDRYDHIPSPELYYELCRCNPGKGFEKSNKIDNAVVWQFQKVGKV